MGNEFKELIENKIVKMQWWSTYTHLLMKFTGLREHYNGRVTVQSPWDGCTAQWRKFHISQADLTKILKVWFCCQAPTTIVTTTAVHETNNMTLYIGRQIDF